ncbi:hypothetical protein CEXT_695821 [Caerostris extrusa]|uniref:Uncharacterized protein n=1 Tax=Caerostris extrusa TaxID=172846 RepID=A0AAV4ULJ2_CAEEX|nr:hypothetical protein CEXT_695821 [Caerostris extrusa]
MRTTNQGQGRSTRIYEDKKLAEYRRNLDSLVAELGVLLAKLPITEEELQTTCATYRAQQNPTSRTKSTTSQQKRKMNQTQRASKKSTSTRIQITRLTKFKTKQPMPPRCSSILRNRSVGLLTRK